MQISSLKVLHRNRIHAEPDDPVLKDGAVQKLVLKADWEERRWNDRRLVLYKNRVCYLWNKGDKTIDQILAENISHLAAIYEDTNNTSTSGSPQIRKSRSFVSESSIWDTVLFRKSDHEEELQSCFLLRTQTANGTRREYVFRTESQEEARAWVEQVRGAVHQHFTVYNSIVFL